MPAESALSTAAASQKQLQVTDAVVNSKKGRVIEAVLLAVWPSVADASSELDERVLKSACTAAHTRRLIEWVRFCP